MQITPIQCESLGTRSLATLVETPDVKILLDPGCALGIRFRLLPHPREYDLAHTATEHICFDLAHQADAIFISHYHYDHFVSSYKNYTHYWYSPELTDALYTDKLIYAKHPRQSINFSQKKRGNHFEQMVHKLVKELIWCDSLQFSFNDTQLRFSPPVWHGAENSRLGYVIQCCIQHADQTFVFAPDSQCLNQPAINWILAQSPDLLLVGGPPLYLMGWKIKNAVFDLAKRNLLRLTQRIPRVLVDHHLLRSLDWESWLHEIIDATKRENHSCECIASYRNIPPNLLEARRKELYEQDPPDRDFLKWTKLAKTIRAQTPPPITNG